MSDYLAERKPFDGSVSQKPKRKPQRNEHFFQNRGGRMPAL